MGNIVKLLKRDLVRLIKAPAALVVVFALLILPSVYTWYNVLGFWDPYENTGNVRVAVVNQDKGAFAEQVGEINVGKMVEEELRQNNQLGWWFSDYDQAMEELESGKTYAVFIIPENFSQEMTGALSGTYEKSIIKYYVNEKAGPVSPKITDAGSSTLEETINSRFIETVSKVLLDKVCTMANDASHLIDSSTSQAVSKILSAQQTIQTMQGSLEEAVGACDELQTKISEINNALELADEDFDEASKQAEVVIADIESLQEKLSSLAGEVADQSNQSALLATQALNDSSWGGYEKASQSVSSTLDAIPQTANETISAINVTIGQLSQASQSVKYALQAEQMISEETKSALKQLSEVVATSKRAFSETGELLGGINSDLERVKTDLYALSSSENLVTLINDSNMNTDAIAEFIGSPTTLETEKLYPFNSYGAAMAPLFMNLTFWIGAFMLLIIMRQEVDSEGVPGVTLTQRFLARYLMFAGLAAIQAVVCCLGCMAIGVEVYSPLALCFAAVVTSLTFLAIIYTLSVLFQHVGKAICIILIFLQIPAATGLYPIEMTAPFYQMVYPILPFTYGINAMREAIAGFYDMNYVTCLSILGVYLITALLVGLFLRTPMSNVNRMVAKKIEEGGMYNGESLDLPVRQYRSSQILRVLTSKEEYRQDFIKRYVRFQKWYSRFGLVALGLTVLIPVLATVIMSFTNGEKVVLLTLWLLWIILLVFALILMEYFGYRFEREMDLDTMSSDELIKLYAARNRILGSHIHARDAVGEIERRDSEYRKREEGEIDE